jgi:prophage DNA circulation protein
VDFKVSTNDTTVGRRTALHEFPLRNRPYVEDLGRSTRRFTIDGFLIGDNFLEQLADMIWAMEAPGPGTLVHPIYGKMDVSVIQDTTFSHIMREGRIVRFRFECIQTEEKMLLPEAVSDAPALVEDQVETTQNANVDRFVAQIPLSLVTFDFLDLLILAKKLLAMLKAITRAIKAIIRSGLGLRWIADGLAGILQFVNDMDMAFAGLVTDLAATCALIKSSLNQLGALATGKRKFAVIEALLAFPDTIDSLIPPESGEGTVQEQAETNRKAMTNLVKVIAVSEACRAAMNIEYASAEETVYMLDKIGSSLDSLLSEAAAIFDDERFFELQTLRALVVQALHSIGDSLTSEESQEIQAGVRSTLVLAYDLYDDVARESDIVGRNTTITHPGFIPLNTAIKVLAE